MNFKNYFYKNHNFLNLIFFSILILCGWFVRLGDLDKYAFSQDEYWHLYISNAESLTELFTNIFREEVHPPLSFLIWYFALKISDNALWLRMFSIIPGLLLIPSIYVFGRLYISKNAGYFLSAFVTFGSTLMTLSITIRAYSLLFLIMCWMVIFVYRYIKKPKKKYLFYYFLLGLLAVQTHHGVVFFIFVLGIALIFDSFFKKNKKHLLKIIFGHAVLCFFVLLHFYFLFYVFDFSPDINTRELGSFVYSIMYALLYINVAEVLNFNYGGLSEESIRYLDVFQILLFFITTIFLIKEKKWLLLSIVFLPIFLNIATNFLKLYPFFLEPSRRLTIYYINFLIFAFYFWYIVFCYISKKIKLNFIEPRILILFLSAPLFYYVSTHNYLKNSYPNCFEYFEKEDEDIFYKKLDQYAREEGNIVILTNKIIWKFKFFKEGRVEKISKNLAILHKENYKIYIVGFEERIALGAGQHKEDIFNLIKAENKKQKIKSITFGDICYKRYNCNLLYGNSKDSEDFSIFRNIDLKNIEDRFYLTKENYKSCQLNISFVKFNKKIIQN
jgi:hypothetical protein